MVSKEYKKNDICMLSELKVGQKCILQSFTNDNKALRRRLLDMGLTKGVEIEVKMISPLGDPTSILLRGYQLCLRKVDMDNIVVQVTKNVSEKQKRGDK